MLNKCYGKDDKVKFFVDCRYILHASREHSHLGPFNNYVDKMRGGVKK